MLGSVEKSSPVAFLSVFLAKHHLITTLIMLRHPSFGLVTLITRIYEQKLSCSPHSFFRTREPCEGASGLLNSRDFWRCLLNSRDFCRCLLNSRDFWRCLLNSRDFWRCLLNSRDFWRCLLNSRDFWRCLLNSRDFWRCLLNSRDFWRCLLNSRV